MRKQYVIQIKTPVRNEWGVMYLESFCQCPIWKEGIKNANIFNSNAEAIRTQKKYGGTVVPYLPINSQWILKQSWGDVDEHYTLPDNEKTTIINIKELTPIVIKYTIVYDGAESPDKLHEATYDEFLNSYKPKAI